MALNLQFAGDYADEIKRNFKQLLASLLGIKQDVTALEADVAALQTIPYIYGAITGGSATAVANNTDTDLGGTPTSLVLPAGNYIVHTGARFRINFATTITSALGALLLTDMSNALLQSWGSGISTRADADDYFATIERVSRITIPTETEVKLRGRSVVVGGSGLTRDIDLAYAIFYREP